MCVSCGWEELADNIDELLDDSKYEFAEDTLNGIKDWVTEHEHCTPAQVQAVENIRSSVRD